MCGRILSDPDSAKKGIGPDCAGKTTERSIAIDTLERIVREGPKDGLYNDVPYAESTLRDFNEGKRIRKSTRRWIAQRAFAFKEADRANPA